MSGHTTSVIIQPGQPMPDILDRVTTPGSPGQYGMGSDAAELAFAYHSLGLGDQYKETYINHDTALTFSAVWACIRLISQSLAGVGWHVYEKSMDGRRKMPIEDDVAWTLDMQANPEMSAFEFRQVMLKDALTWGNGYAEIERTMGGRFLWLWRIAPERVDLIRDEEGQLWYEIDNKGRSKTYLRPENVFHLRGLGPDGLVGWSVIEMARKAIQLGLYEEKFGLQFFRRGPMPGGFLTLPKAMTEQQRRETRRSFEELYSGSQNAHRVVVLSDGMTFDPASMPNEDAQFLQSRTFQINEICRWFGVPPHKVSEMSRATFSNIEEQNIEFVTDCLLAWASRLESEANIKCYTQRRQGRRYTRLNLDALMRGNSETQTSTATQKVSGGIITPNEAREYFDMNPVPEGDVLLVQGAMIPLERAIEEPPEPASPVAPPMQPESSQNGNGDGNTTDPTNRFAALSLVTSTANGFKLAESLQAFNEDQERDEHGRFGSGGGDSGDKTDGKDGGKSDPVQTEREAQREVEDNKVDEQRAAEDTKVSEDRDKEESDAQEQRDREDTQQEHADAERQGQRGKEDTERDAGREKEDNDRQDERDAHDQRVQNERADEDAERDGEREKVDLEREKEDAERQSRIDKEDEDIEIKDDKEDAQKDADRQAEDERITTEREKQDSEANSAREKEDAQREGEREAKDNRDSDQRDEEDEKINAEREAQDKALDDRFERGEITEDQHTAEQDRSADRRDKEDEQRDLQREEEDAKDIADREKEDAKIGAQRGKEDAKLEATRDKEDTQREARREKEDEKRDDERGKRYERIQKERDREDEKRDAPREKEDARREKEDEKRDSQREKEDAKRDTEREKEDSRVEKEREKQDTTRDREREQQDRQSEKESTQREAVREKQDREREKRWEAEDKQREAVREKEDRERERQRASEDRGAK